VPRLQLTIQLATLTSYCRGERERERQRERERERERETVVFKVHRGTRGVRLHRLFHDTSGKYIILPLSRWEVVARPLNLRAPVEPISQSAVDATYRSRSAAATTLFRRTIAKRERERARERERERENVRERLLSSRRLFNGTLMEARSRRPDERR